MTTKPTTTERRVELVPLSKLAPHARNPKQHDTALIDASVARFGFIDPIAVDGRTGKIISGHGRLKALKAMQGRGETPPEGVQVDESGEWLIPTATGWSSRSDTEAHAALIALNRATEVGGWVDEELLGLLENLSTYPDGLAGVGFGLEDVDDLLLKVGDPEDDDESMEGLTTVDDDLKSAGGGQTAVASSTLVFDSAEDLGRWNAFIRNTRNAAPAGMTSASRVLWVLDGAGLLDTDGADGGAGE